MLQFIARERSPTPTSRRRSQPGQMDAIRREKTDFGPLAQTVLVNGIAEVSQSCDLDCIRESGANALFSRALISQATSRRGGVTDGGGSGLGS